MLKHVEKVMKPYLISTQKAEKFICWQKQRYENDIYESEFEESNSDDEDALKIKAHFFKNKVYFNQDCDCQ